MQYVYPFSLFRKEASGEDASIPTAALILVTLPHFAGIAGTAPCTVGKVHGADGSSNQDEGASQFETPISSSHCSILRC